MSSDLSDNLLILKNEFLLSLVNNNYSEHTIKNYARDLMVFELFLTNYGLEFDKLNKLNIDEYKGYLRAGKHLDDLDKLNLLRRNNPKKDGKRFEEIVNSNTFKKSSQNALRNYSSGLSKLNSRSINRMLSTLRSYLVFLVENDKKIPIAPSAIKMIRTEKKESQVAELEELISLVEAPERFESKTKVKFRNRAILEILFSTGMRISELVNLDIENINYNKKEQRMQDNKIFIMGKGKKQRFVYLTERAIYHLVEYLKMREDDLPAVFIPYRGQRVNLDNIGSARISQRYVQSVIKKYRRLLGIQIPTTPHSLRHGFATYLAEKGANPAAIQRLLGHESLQTTTRYVHSSDRFAQQSHQEFHPLQD